MPRHVSQIKSAVWVHPARFTASHGADGWQLESRRTLRDQERADYTTRTLFTTERVRECMFRRGAICAGSNPHNARVLCVRVLMWPIRNQSRPRTLRIKWPVFMPYHVGAKMLVNKSRRLPQRRLHYPRLIHLHLSARTCSTHSNVPTSSVNQRFASFNLKINDMQLTCIVLIGFDVEHHVIIVIWFKKILNSCNIYIQLF